MERDATPPRASARSITVTVTLFAGLRRALPPGVDPRPRHTLPEGARLADLLATLGIDPAVDLTAAVDGEIAERHTLLRDGAEVVLLAPMEGGSGPPAARRQRPSRLLPAGGGAPWTPNAKETTTWPS